MSFLDLAPCSHRAGLFWGTGNSVWVISLGFPLRERSRQDNTECIDLLFYFCFVLRHTGIFGRLLYCVVLDCARVSKLGGHVCVFMSSHVW